MSETGYLIVGLAVGSAVGVWVGISCSARALSKVLDEFDLMPKESERKRGKHE